MIAYKGFEKGLICRGYQFSMGLNRTEEANCRENGFHCAENPLDCLTYYSNMDSSEYYIVNAGGDVHEDGSDTKISCTELTVIKKLSAMDFFLHALAFMVDHPKREWSSHVSRDRGEAGYKRYAVVRGADPVARGGLGCIFAFAKEDGQGNILQVALAEVDGKRILPDVWYGVELTAREAVAA